LEEAELANEMVQAAKHEKEVAVMLALRREQRAKDKAALMDKDRLGLPPVSRTDDEWAALSAVARRLASKRDRDYLKGIFESHQWRAADIAATLDSLGLVGKLFESQPFFAAHYQRVGSLLKQMEREHFGLDFGLYLHFEMRLTLPKILQLTQAASKSYSRVLDRYAPKALLYDPYHKKEGASVFLKVPRIAPSATKLLPKIQELEKKVGIEAAEDGRIAFKSWAVVCQEIVARDPGQHGMPPLSAYAGGLELPIIISFDATGFGSQQLTTVAARNPYLPQSNFQLRLFGLGNVGDDKDGAKRLLGPNLALINEMIQADEACILCDPSGSVKIKPHIYSVLDVSALRLVNTHRSSPHHNPSLDCEPHIYSPWDGFLLRLR